MRSVVIIGGGFAGLRAAQVLSRHKTLCSVTLIDKKPTSDFLPLLPDVLGRQIDPAYLAYPLGVAARVHGFTLARETVRTVDLAAQSVTTDAAVRRYEYLLIASGSETNFYGNDLIQKEAYTIDSVADVRHLLEALSARAYSHYVVVGGGYTGIEVAGNLRRYLAQRSLSGHICVVERAPGILGPLPEWMKQGVRENCDRSGIEILVNAGVDRVENGSVVLAGGRRMDDALLVWAAGVRTADFIRHLNVEKNAQGRIKVDEYLRVTVPGGTGICFAAGDAALFEYRGAPLRMAIQFSLTQGACAAGNIVRSIEGRGLERFTPVDLGYIVPLANNHSFGTVMGVRVQGRLATLMHFVMCVFRSWSARNKWGVIRDLASKGGGSMIDTALLTLRFGLGVMFAGHGLQKTFGLFGGPGIDGFAQGLAGMGFAPAGLWAYIAGYTELLGGLCLIAGLGTRVSAALLFIVMAVAMKVHMKGGFFAQNGGFEYPFIIACACLSLLLAGAGRFSLDKKIRCPCKK